MWRVVRRAGWMLALGCGSTLLACSENPPLVPLGSTPVPNGMASGGSAPIPVGTGTPVTPPPVVCQGFPPIRFPLTRYSVTDIDRSLDAVLGEGTPRLRDLVTADDSGYARPINRSFVEALGGVARERARSASAQAAKLTLCEDEAADGCLQGWLRRYGDQLYRRPLTREQVGAYLVPFYETSSDADRVEAATRALVAMVLSPYFVLRVEVRGGADRISSYDVASRLAYLATRRIPDAELRARAETGELLEPQVRLAELRRLWKTDAGREARELQFFEWLRIPDEPAETGDAGLAEEMTAQARAFIRTVYEEDRGSFSAFFTSSRLPLNDRLAAHYGLPLPGTRALEPVELDPQLFAGLLSTGAFLSRYPRPSQRGVAVLSSLLCTDVVAPPAHVVPLPAAETPRRRLEAALGTDARCVACHATFDSAGLALEAFDDEGRLTGFPTDGSILLSPSEAPVTVSGPVALGDALVRSLSARDCLARRSLEYVSQAALDHGTTVRVIAPSTGAHRSWIGCLSAALSPPGGSLTTVFEAIVQSDLLVTRADPPRRVVALDTSADPVQHAYEEALQLRGAYGTEDAAALDDYTLALGLMANQGAGGEGGAGQGGAAGDP